jgi:predicted phage-related endonuclease
MDAQRTEQWFADRAGRITASRICDVMAFEPDSVFKSGPRAGQVKSGVRKARLDYITQLAAERITGNAKNQVNAAALDWGKEWEPHAREAYEEETGTIVIETGFAVHPEYDFIGASADFLVGAIGGGEIKCPASQEVHLETLENGLPVEHIEQIQGGLWVTGRQWWDFVSFHPFFPRPHHLYIQRVRRDDAYISQMRDACLSLEAEVQRIAGKYLPTAQGTL